MIHAEQEHCYNCLHNWKTGEDLKGKVQCKNDGTIHSMLHVCDSWAHEEEIP